MNEATIRTFRDLLLTIYDEQKSDWSEEKMKGRKPTNKARQFYTLYSYRGWDPIERKEFEKWLSGNDNEMDIDFLERRTVLFLPPLVEKNSEFVPILYLCCKISSTINSVRLYVLLVRLDEVTQKPYCFGFLFDSPENEHY